MGFKVLLGVGLAARSPSRPIAATPREGKGFWGAQGAGPAPMVETRVTGRVTIFGGCWGSGRCSCLRGSPGVVNVQKNCS